MLTHDNKSAGKTDLFGRRGREDPASRASSRAVVKKYSENAKNIEKIFKST